MRLHATLKMVPDWAQSRIAFVDAKGRFGLGQLHVSAPELFAAPSGNVAAQQITAFTQSGHTSAPPGPNRRVASRSSTGSSAARAWRSSYRSLRRLQDGRSSLHAASAAIRHCSRNTASKTKFIHSPLAKRANQNRQNFLCIDYCRGSWASAVFPKFVEKQPQILRLRLPQRARQTPFRMTVHLCCEFQRQDTRWLSFSTAMPCSVPASSWSGCLPRPSPRRRSRGRCRYSNTTSQE